MMNRVPRPQQAGRHGAVPSRPQLGSPVTPRPRQERRAEPV